MKLLTLSTFFILFLFSCSNDETKTNGGSIISQDDLIGYWVMKESSSIRKSDLKHFTMEFRKNGIAIIMQYSNGTSIWHKGKFKITKAGVIVDGMVFNNVTGAPESEGKKTITYAITIKGNQLTLHPPSGEKFVYQKSKKPRPAEEEKGREIRKEEPKFTQSTNSWTYSGDAFTGADMIDLTCEKGKVLGTITDYGSLECDVYEYKGHRIIVGLLIEGGNTASNIIGCFYEGHNDKIDKPSTNVIFKFGGLADVKSMNEIIQYKEDYLKNKLEPYSTLGFMGY